MRSASAPSGSRSCESAAVLLRLALGGEGDVDAGRPVAPVEARRARLDRGALAQVAVGQPALAQARVDERRVEPLDRDGDGLRGGDGEAVLVLADLAARRACARSSPTTACTFQASGCSPSLLGEPARGLAVGACSAAPASSSRSNHSSQPRPVRSRIVSSEVASATARAARRRAQQPGARRRVALAGLLHPRADQALEGSLCGHRVLLLVAAAPRLTLTRPRREGQRPTGVPKARASFASAGPAA